MSEQQSPPPPSPTDHRGTIAVVVGQLLTYIDRPWKVAAVTILVVVGGLGWVVHQHSDQLIAAWLTPTEARLDTSGVGTGLEKLRTESGADLVQIWSIVDHNANVQRFVSAIRRDGERPVIPNPRELPVIDRDSTAQDIGAVLDVIQGHSKCIVLSETGAPLSRRLFDRGMNYGCAIPIGSRKTFVGVIYLAYVQAPNKSDENVALTVAQGVAAQLGVH